MPRKSTKRPKPVPKKDVHARPESVAVGDEVRLPVELPNQIRHYDPREEFLGRSGDGIEGIVYSIREIATGKLVAKTQGPLEKYVLEVLHDRTFHLQYSSARNTGGPKGASEVHDNQNWMRIREALRQMASRSELASQSPDRIRGDLFSSLLDGWRVVKLRANLVEVL